MQESKSLCHQAVEAQQSSFQEVSGLKQQLSDLQGDVLQPLQAEHGAVIAALSTVTQLYAEWAPAESPQPADRAHLMAPAVHHAVASTTSGSAVDPTHSPRFPPSDAPGMAPSMPVGAYEAAEGAVKAVQQMLSQARGERAALLQARHLAEVGHCHVTHPVATCCIPHDTERHACSCHMAFRLQPHLQRSSLSRRSA